MKIVKINKALKELCWEVEQKIRTIAGGKMGSRKVVFKWWIDIKACWFSNEGYTALKVGEIDDVEYRAG